MPRRAVDLDRAAGGGVIVQRVVEQQQAGAVVGGVGDQDLAVIGEGGGEVLDGVGGAGGGFQQAVNVEDRRAGDGAAAVDGGGLQLERGADAVAEAAAVDLDAAAGVVERVVLQQQAGAGVGVGDQQLAVVGEIAGAEVLDDVGGALAVRRAGRRYGEAAWPAAATLPSMVVFFSSSVELFAAVTALPLAVPSTWIEPPAVT